MSEGAADAPQDVTAGQLLRRAREAAGLHVASLAVALKVPVRKLEALEEDRHDLLPDAVFVRALASSVCRTLKIDAQPVLERLPQTAKPRLVHDHDGINAPFRAPGDGPKPSWIEQLSRPVALSVIAILLAAIVVMFLPVTRRDAEPSASRAVMPPPAALAASSAPMTLSAPVTMTTPAEKPVAVPSPAPPTPAPPPTTATAPAPVVVAQPAPAPAAAPSAAAAASPTLRATPDLPAVAPAASASAARAAGIVVFRTRADSWIQVTDARGTAVFQRLMTAGETAGATGALPLTVTVGSVGATDVEVRGKPFNLGPVSKDNVARFEVK